MLREYARAAFVALSIATVLRLLVAQGYAIPSSSMLPTLLAGDHVLVSKLHYGVPNPFGNGWLLSYRSPRPGDVIVFVLPLDRDKLGELQRDYVKRVVAVEGDVVEILQGKVVVNGHEFDPGHAARGREAHHGRRVVSRFGPRTVPPNGLFVLGDNRRDSKDSREWGFVGTREVQGKVVSILWSWDQNERVVRWARIGRVVE